MKSDVPRAYIRKEYLEGKLPNGNPFGVKKNGVLYSRGSKEYKMQTSILAEFGKLRRSTPMSSKITF